MKYDVGSPTTKRIPHFRHVNSNVTYSFAWKYFQTIREGPEYRKTPQLWQVKDHHGWDH